VKRFSPDDVIALAQLMKDTFLVLDTGDGMYDGRLAWSATCYLLQALWRVMPESDHAQALNRLKGFLPVTEVIPADGRPRPRAPAGFRSGGRFR